MRSPVERGCLSRSAKSPGEPVTLRREGDARKWHARAEGGELIGQDRYRHDLESWLETEGFSFTYAETA